jgi:pyruvate/2-oxoglutarate dehydrogenase complex dihydrolipoamide acyltransferase (E2) component
MDKQNDRHTVFPFPLARRIIVDGLTMAHKKHTIHLLLDLDVTKARKIIREHRARAGESISFTGFVTVCLAQAVAADRTVHAYRRPINKLVVYEDVDVAVLVEHEVEGDKIATFEVIRAAQRKTVAEVHAEIRAAQHHRLQDRKEYAPWKGFLLLPSLIRRSFWWALPKFPSTWKRLAGTVAISAIGMHGKGAGWGIPIPSHTLSATLGGITEKPGVVDGRVEVRESLSVTLSFDHDIVDGVPAARFAARFRELVERASGLENVEEKVDQRQS